MDEQKYYVIGCTNSAAWEHVDSELTQDGSTDSNIPARPVECTDCKDHSPTRATYLLTDQEAEQLSHSPEIKFVQLDVAMYPDLFPPRPDELHCANRYPGPVKNYRNFSGLLPGSPNSSDANRAGYQLLRSSQYSNPWQGQSVSTVIANTIPNTNTGKNIDVIVGDDGCWFGHADFQSNPTGNVAFPDGYVGGNKLPGGGTCDVLDVVLEGPYYIDPGWFDASPGTRLTTRWDGTTVPVEQVARDWWGNSAARSSQFSTAGTVTIPSYYTRANCNGSKTARSIDGDHGTPCAGQAYGRTYGWAYNANKWFINAYGNNGLWPVDNYFDVMKIFHVNKPVNPLYGTKDPTISSNSWGFREGTPSTGYYYFRQGTSGSGGVAFSSKPAFMAYIGSQNDGRIKGEMLVNNLTTAGDELIQSGVIFVSAAGNDTQKQVGSSDPDFDNYWSTGAATPLSSATHTALDGISLCYNTINRRGFPQQLGKYISGGQTVYPVINVGALDDSDVTGGLEGKVGYSDMGNEIDCYAPGDGTLSSSQTTASYNRYDQTPGGLTSYDRYFNGTSSACPTATGLIATVLETNRSWGWQEIRTWLQSLSVQSALTFYQGPDPQTATSVDWSAVNGLFGGQRKVIYNNITVPVVTTVNLSGSGLTIGGSGLSISFV